MSVKNIITEDESLINLMIDYFFKSPTVVKYDGWRNISESLLKTGKCLTTIQADRMWIGGIGNFIKYNDYTEGVDLIMIELDYEDFIISDYFKNFLSMQYDRRVGEIDLIKQEHKMKIDALESQMFELNRLNKK